MARQLNTSKATAIIPMPHPVFYDGSEDNWDTMDGIFDELGTMAEIVNHNYHNFRRAQASLIGQLDEALTHDNEFKQKLTGRNIKKDALKPEKFEWGRKPFATQLTFWTDYVFGVTKPGQRWRWGADGVISTNANIFFAPYNDSAFVKIINAGTYATLGVGPRIFFIEPRESNFTTVQNTNQPAHACKDGRIALCVSSRTYSPPGTPANLDYEYTLYGGGLHMVE